jgi:hypothetical protein
MCFLQPSALHVICHSARLVVEIFSPIDVIQSVLIHGFLSLPLLAACLLLLQVPGA